MKKWTPITTWNTKMPQLRIKKLDRCQLSAENDFY